MNRGPCARYRKRVSTRGAGRISKCPRGYISLEFLVRDFHGVLQVDRKCLRNVSATCGNRLVLPGHIIIYYFLHKFCLDDVLQRALRMRAKIYSPAKIISCPL